MSKHKPSKSKPAKRGSRGKPTRRSPARRPSTSHREPREPVAPSGTLAALVHTIGDDWPVRAAGVIVTAHIPGREAGRGMCGSGIPELPAGDARLWGTLHERAPVAQAVLAEFDGVLLVLASLLPGRVTACSGCRGNLSRMIEGDGRRLETWHGRTKNSPTADHGDTVDA